MVPEKAFPTCLRAFLIICVVTLLTEVSGRPHSSKLSSRTTTECDEVDIISAVCYYCASIYQDEFDAVHQECCKGTEQVRLHCLAWYTEDPKRG